MNSESTLRSRSGLSPMSPSELERFKGLLLEQDRAVRATLGGLSRTAQQTPVDAGGGASSLPVHLADLASDTFEQELSIDFIERAQAELRDIQEALERIEHRCYGLCAQCAAAIGVPRLEAMPATELCMNCKTAAERRGDTPAR